MLRTYFAQQWLKFLDPALDEVLYDSAGFERFVGVDLGVAAPDETNVCPVWRSLEEAGVGRAVLETVNHPLKPNGIGTITGTVVNQAVIHASSSTKNSSGKRGQA